MGKLMQIPVHLFFKQELFYRAALWPLPVMQAFLQAPLRALTSSLPTHQAKQPKMARERGLLRPWPWLLALGQAAAADQAVNQLSQQTFQNKRILYHPEFSSKLRKIVWGTEQL